jgi:hypothetical protein
MRKLSIAGAAAILAATTALPSMAQAACAQYDPNCATYPMPKQESDAANAGNPRNARAEATGAQSSSYQRHHRARSAASTKGMEQR